MKKLTRREYTAKYRAKTAARSRKPKKRQAGTATLVIPSGGTGHPGKGLVSQRTTEDET